MHICSVTQLDLTLCDPMDCNLPGSSVLGISQQEYWSGLLLPTPGEAPLQGLNPSLLCLLHWQVDSLPLDHHKKHYFIFLI